MQRAGRVAQDLVFRFWFSPCSNLVAFRLLGRQKLAGADKTGPSKSRREKEKGLRPGGGEWGVRFAVSTWRG